MTEIDYKALTQDQKNSGDEPVSTAVDGKSKDGIETGEATGINGSTETAIADASPADGGITNDTSNGKVIASKLNESQVSSSGNISHINREFQEKSTMKQAKALNISYLDLGKTPLNPDFLKLVDIESSKNARAIVFFRIGKKIRLAVEKPDTPEITAIIEKLKKDGFNVDISLVSSAGIDDALNIYDKTQKYRKIELVKTVSEGSIETYEKEIENLVDFAKKIEGVTAEQGLNLLNIGAMKTNASDVHYEPEEHKIVVRFRIDGVLHKVFELKPDVYRNIVNQMKYEAKMQLNVDSIPQDGRYTFEFNKKKIAVRVSSIPTPYGESFVCRFLISPERALTLEELGFEGISLIKLQKATKISHGMILSTGPTGSGKTTTLYSLLSMMNNAENKVITLEDPVEYHLEGITQSQINEKRGYTFAAGLRTVLRQDPDLVMLGEIRDLETAETGAQAALTGHILLSSLHTNSALETIPRLINMGLPPFMIAPALDTIVAQRLVRKLCANCGTKETPSDCEKKEFEKVINNLKAINPGAAVEIPTEIPKIHGCEKCSNTGYKGRLVIAEVVTVTAEMKRLMMNNSSSVDLIAAARKDGIITMREDGFIKVAKGLTTLEEVYRVTNVT